MSLLVQKAKNQIEEIFLNAAKKAMDNGELCVSELTPFSVEVPANRDHGDYAVNAAMVWSKAFRNAPRKIAEILEEHVYDKITISQLSGMCNVSPSTIKKSR